jgi:hypothetical protein
MLEALSAVEREELSIERRKDETIEMIEDG